MAIPQPLQPPCRGPVTPPLKTTALDSVRDDVVVLTKTLDAPSLYDEYS